MTPAVKAMAAAAIGAAAIWLSWPDHAAVPADATASPTSAPARPQAQAEQPSALGGMAFFSEQHVAQPVPAAQSMAQTRLHGDPEAPPIVRSEATPAAPTAAELADPKAYLAFEARQSLRLYASYVQAVDRQLPILRDDIARGRALGIAPEKIAKAEAKARGLEQMRAQLIKDHPELGQ
jgi:hypothetical protein